MTQTKPGRAMLDVTWTGNCHICRAGFTTTGDEINRLKPGDHLTRITAIKCPACGAKNQLHLQPQDPPHPPPLPESDDQKAAREERMALLRQRDTFRQNELKALLENPTEDAGVPGYIQVLSIHFFEDTDQIGDLLFPIEVEAQFFSTEPKLLSVQAEVPEIGVANIFPGFALDHPGFAFGRLGHHITVEPFAELVGRLAAAQQHLTRTPA